MDTIRIVANNVATEQIEKVIWFNTTALNSKEGIETVTEWAKEIIENAPYLSWSQFVITDRKRNNLKMYNAFNYYEEFQECDYQGEDIVYKKRQSVPSNELATELVMRIRKEFN